MHYVKKFTLPHVSVMSSKLCAGVMFMLKKLPMAGKYVKCILVHSTLPMKETMHQDMEVYSVPTHFLDASLHLYKEGLSVRRSVGRFCHYLFFYFYVKLSNY